MWWTRGPVQERYSRDFPCAILSSDYLAAHVLELPCTFQLSCMEVSTLYSVRHEPWALSLPARRAVPCRTCVEQVRILYRSRFLHEGLHLPWGPLLCLIPRGGFNWSRRDRECNWYEICRLEIVILVGILYSSPFVTLIFYQLRMQPSSGVPTATQNKNKGTMGTCHRDYEVAS